MHKTFTRIKGISDRPRRLPRIGKIRLGVKKKSLKTGNEYPAEVDYFVVPEDVQKVFGEKPKTLDIMLPVNSIDVLFPQAYKAYGSDERLKCKGDGETALRWTEKGQEEVPCPCDWLENRKCCIRASLMFFIPSVSLAGVFQLDTGSYHNINTVNSYLAEDGYLMSLIGRNAMIPLKLIREEVKVQHQTDKGPETKKHNLLRLLYTGSLEEINHLKQDTNAILTRTQSLKLEAPVEEGPEPDTPIILVDDEEDFKKPEEIIVPPEEIIPEPHITFQDKLEMSPDVETLKGTWGVITSLGKTGVLNPDDIKKLGAIKNKRKKQLTAPMPKTAKNGPIPNPCAGCDLEEACEKLNKTQEQKENCTMQLDGTIDITEDIAETL